MWKTCCDWTAAKNSIGHYNPIRRNISSPYIENTSNGCNADRGTRSVIWLEKIFFYRSTSTARCTVKIRSSQLCTPVTFNKWRKRMGAKRKRVRFLWRNRNQTSTSKHQKLCVWMHESRRCANVGPRTGQDLNPNAANLWFQSIWIRVVPNFWTLSFDCMCFKICFGDWFLNSKLLLLAKCSSSW